MTDDQLEPVRALVAKTRHRVKVTALADGQRVVVKRWRRARSPWRGRIVNGIARLVGLDVLQAAPAAGGAEAQAVEVQRLRSLAAAGVRVPALLHVDPGFIVMEHVAGPSLAERIEQGGDAGHAAWRLGLRTLLDVHRRGAWLSQAFARNFIVTADGGLAMIDFEDDPGTVMPRAEAQARDWLAYLHSTAWQLTRPHAELRAELAQALRDEDPAVARLVLQAGRKLGAARHLPRSRRPLGREVVGLQALASLLRPGRLPQLAGGAPPG